MPTPRLAALAVLVLAAQGTSGLDNGLGLTPPLGWCPPPNPPPPHRTPPRQQATAARASRRSAAYN